MADYSIQTYLFADVLQIQFKIHICICLIQLNGSIISEATYWLWLYLDSDHEIFLMKNGFSKELYYWINNFKPYFPRIFLFLFLFYLYSRYKKDATVFSEVYSLAGCMHGICVLLAR